MYEDKLIFISAGCARDIIKMYHTVFQAGFHTIYKLWEKLNSDLNDRSSYFHLFRVSVTPCHTNKSLNNSQSQLSAS